MQHIKSNLVPKVSHTRLARLIYLPLYTQNIRYFIVAIPWHWEVWDFCIINYLFKEDNNRLLTVFIELSEQFYFCCKCFIYLSESLNHASPLLTDALCKFTLLVTFAYIFVTFGTVSKITFCINNWFFCNFIALTFEVSSCQSQIAVTCNWFGLRVTQ